ncbi:MAG TPA: SPFH domain-containing protein [Mycobacteriales bacterium]|nr:SPFH domain-containing protein [Mycobacteriales bacterium]
MGLLDKVKGQFIDIVEFLDDSRDTIVWRFPRQGNEIKMGAQLVCREGQAAVFENEGKIADVFQPGTYTLETQNLPILSDLKGWKYGFNSPFKAEVYFVGTRLYTDMKWGTQEPVTIRDSEFGMVRLRAFGTFGMRVTDPAALIREMVGTDPNFSTDEVQDFLREKMVSEVGTALATSGVPMLDLAANQQAISQKLAETLTTSFADIGIAIPKFIIQNISLPPEVSAALDKRTQMGVLGNLDQFTKFQAATAITEAAQNPGGVAGAGVGLGAGLAMGQQMAAAMQPAAPAAAAAAPPPLPGQAGYFLGINGQQVGPVTIAEMPARIASGELTRDTLVWREGMAEWTRAGDVAEVNAAFPAAPPPLPPTAPPAPPSA